MTRASKCLFIGPVTLMWFRGPMLTKFGIYKRTQWIGRLTLIWPGYRSRLV
jgi:hypothetical protein